MAYTVYCYTNIFNGKKYIGITSMSTTARAGKNGYRYKGCLKFMSAIKKYGFDAFEKEILYVGLTKEEAEQKEIELIAQYNTTDSKFGYNISAGGGVACTSEETRRKISEKRKEYYKTHEAWNKGTGKKKEIIHKDRVAWNKGKHLTEEQKMILSRKNKGKHHSEETRKKISDTWKRLYLDPEIKERQIKGLKSCKRELLQIYCVELNRIFTSINEAVKELNLCKRNLSDCLNGYSDICKGYRFEHCDEKRKQKAEEIRKKRKLHWIQIGKIKPVQCIETGIIYDSCIEAAKSLNKTKGGCISDVCHKRRKSAYGYHWKFIDKEV